MSHDVPSVRVGLAHARMYHDILVVPMTHLLLSAEQEHVGGPVWPDWETADWAGYWRSANYGYRRVDIHPPLSSPQSVIEPGPYFWVGPVYEHFGHQIQDFSSRILGSLLAEPNARLVYALQDGRRSCPQWFWSINEWFGIDPSRVHLVSEPTLYSALSVVPQPEWAGTNPLNAPPDPAYIRALTAHTNTQFPTTAEKSGRYFISRSGLSTGSNILGESAIGADLARRGFSVIFPERLSLREQLGIYASAESLVFSAGSAIHALQLLGRNVSSVTVLRRHPDGADYESIVAPRSEEFSQIDCVKTVFTFGGRFRGAGARSTLDLRCLDESFAESAVFGDMAIRFRRLSYFVSTVHDAVAFLAGAGKRRLMRLWRDTHSLEPRRTSRSTQRTGSTPR